MKFIEKLPKKIFTMLIVIFCLLSISTVKSQTTLRKALDYDGDGKADLVVFRPSDNTWYLNRSGSGDTARQFGSFILDTPVPGDYDGDGKGDIAVWHELNGYFYYLRSSSNTFYAEQFGLAGDEPVARDYDGDGKTDLAVVRRINGVLNWYVSGSSDGFFAYQFGSSETDIPVPGDYDGDGKFDYAVQRIDPNNLTALFYITKSTNGTYYTVEFGGKEDKVVPGDYDGDGKTDLAIAVYFGNEWYWRIVQSSDGFVSNTSYGNPNIGDIPVQGDYNGDGKTDIAVWNNRDGMFKINGLPPQVFGQRGDMPIASYDTH
ncbi:MAG: FG-GAP repeat domain-containing protein [Pyrinomonadaceae bacterium]